MNTIVTRQLEQVRHRLAGFKQEHVLAFYDHLTTSAQAALLEQCAALPLEMIAHEVESWRHDKSAAHNTHAEIEPAHVVTAHSVDGAKYRAIGEQLIRAGRVACFTVAGGQGTRLGWNAPKGTFAATPILHKSLFEVFAESIRAARTRWECAIPWYVMTSPQNHAATLAYFRSHNWFGLGERTVRLFEQGTLPSLTPEGKILLGARDAIALNPDGHGGAIRALSASGALEEMKRDGIDTLSYFQIDNPLAKAIDPLFLGLHTAHPESSGEVSSKVVAKRDSHEKVGVFCRRENRSLVMEYSDLPAHLAQAVDVNGSLVHFAGSIAIHVFSRAFLEQLARAGHELPLHRAVKKVPFVDLVTGELTEPSKANAIKLESFIFDAVPLAERSLIFETAREEEFAPIKNADGEDSPATSARAQSNRAARWLEQCGVTIDRDTRDGGYDATIELSPLTALDAEQLGLCPNLPKRIAAGARIAL